ncbi:MAG: aldehyde ferredoxin oxidoreductase N-terminal domain-containing protein [Candidatus Bathyarchaeia archaeon]
MNQFISGFVKAMWRLERANHVWGKDTYETDEILRGETDNKAVVACIGPAGERLVKLASIVTEGRHARIAGRAGLGAVMGSKNLKAIVVRGTKEPNVLNEELLERSVKEVFSQIVDNR